MFVLVLFYAKKDESGIKKANREQKSRLQPVKNRQKEGVYDLFCLKFLLESDSALSLPIPIPNPDLTPSATPNACCHPRLPPLSATPVCQLPAATPVCYPERLLPTRLDNPTEII